MSDSWKLLTPQTWPDFEALFEKYHGVGGACWCVYHLVPYSVFSKMAKPERHDYQQSRVEKGSQTGLLHYIDGTAVGWCQFGPAAEYEFFNHNRAYKKWFSETNPQPADWRISCFFIDKPFRKKGLSKLILSEALQAISELGGGVVEAFPYNHTGTTPDDFSGSLSLYQAQGFEAVTPLGSLVLMRKRV